MRKIEQAMVAAVIEKRNWKSGNSEVSVEKNSDGSEVINVYLHRNPIASLVLRQGEEDVIHVSLGGWGSVVSRSRVNALLQGIVPGAWVYQKGGNQFFQRAGGKAREIGVSEWVEA